MAALVLRRLVRRKSIIWPFATDTELGLVYMPIDARTAQVLLHSFGDFWVNLDHLAIQSESINVDPTLSEQIYDILIGRAQRLSNCANDGITGKARVLEG